MADHPLPEMMRLSLSDLALRIKIMKIKLGSSIEDVLARALDPPVSINVQRAVSMLVEVIEATQSFWMNCWCSTGASFDLTWGDYSYGQTSEQTSNGCTSWEIPSHLNYISLLGPCSHYCCHFELQVAICGTPGPRTRCGSSQRLFPHRFVFHTWLNCATLKLLWPLENSDFLTIHNAFSSWRRACANPNLARKFCRTNFLSHQVFHSIQH